MSYLDGTAYDLTTPAGQQTAVDDLLTELNRQYQSANLPATLQIAAYGKGALNPLPFNPGQKFTTSVLHNRNYAPLALVLSAFPGASGTASLQFFSFPYYDGSLAFTADTDQTYLNVHVQYNNNPFLDAYTFDFAYYIFNQPAHV